MGSEPYTDLDDLGVENISTTSTSRLEYVLESLDDADQLKNELAWRSELWAGVSVEELLGALIEADSVLEAYREEAYEDYEPSFRLRDE